MSDSDRQKNNGHGRTATATRHKAVNALLTHRTLGEAAEAAGIAERTLRRWLAEA